MIGISGILAQGRQAVGGGDLAMTPAIRALNSYDPYLRTRGRMSEVV
jgi:hypothetical protein